MGMGLYSFCIRNGIRLSYFPKITVLEKCEAAAM